MPFQMVNAQHRFAQRRAQGTGHARAHQQGTRQAGAPGVGHHIHLGQSFFGLRQDLTRERNDTANVVAAGQLRHHAAIGLVHGNLAVQSVR